MKNGIAKLCDLGKEKIESLMAGFLVGTITHLSPEILAGKDYSFCHDIYGLAILLWELWYGCRVSFEEEQEAVPVFQLGGYIKAGSRPHFKKQFPPVDDLKRLIEKCWSQEAVKRPGASYVQENLKSLYRKLHSKDVSATERLKYRSVERKKGITVFDSTQ